jgi:nicotinate-nucleotide pyrophosphorylase (carboxylating)
MLEPGQLVCQIDGAARSLLTGERTALNFLQTLSGTATVARHYANAVGTQPVQILDTRKTIPGLRLAQKYAVHCGGCNNHRIGLYDAILIKENHIAAAGSIAQAVQQARGINREVMLEIEVETLEQLQQALAAGVDRVLLDNMMPDVLREAVSITEKRVKLEASGNITLDNIAEVAATGIDYISLGSLTKHVHAIDYSMRILIPH